MEAKDIISAIEKTYRDFMNAPCGESWLEMDGKTLQADIGYASEGVEFFHKCLMERLGEEVEE